MDDAYTDEWIGIAEMSRRSGLSADTLRWYEREGMVPQVARGADGRRRYFQRERDLVLMLAALRDTGMPTVLMKEFVELLDEGAASHGRRVAVLSETRELLDERRRALDAAAAALDAKLDHYRHLIATGRDCDGSRVPADQRRMQRSATRTQHHTDVA